MTQQTLGSAITALRKQKGMTQQELADYMGVSDKAVSKWERDQSLPDVYALARLADLFGVTVDQLLGNPVSPAREKVSHAPSLCSMIALSASLALLFLAAVGVNNPNTTAIICGVGLLALSIHTHYDHKH